jgi:beta-galactosidase
VAVAVVLVASSVGAAVAAPTAVEDSAFGDARRVGLDFGWRFLKGDAPGAEAPSFDDASWRAQDLPHDWCIEGPFDWKWGHDFGFLPCAGVGWYRKHFRVPESARGRFVSVEFDGAMSNARVWLNGQEVGGRPYGYIGFAFDLTPHLRYGADANVLAVRLSPEEKSSRWYPGAGIYRHVWLDAVGPVHVARWGTYVRTPEVTDVRATVAVRTEVRIRRAAPAPVVLETEIVDAQGTVVARARSERTLAAAETDSAEQSMTVERPERWDVDRPYLYRLVTTIREGATVLDRTETRFGIRSIAFEAANGFRLNGRRVPIQGVCMHHDLGALGAAVSRRGIERQLQILKTMGVNAVRTSHNPPAPELLDLADEMGIVVMDEAFDMWGKPKLPNGHGKYFAEWGERDLRDMIRRDRNHPSVVLWSIGNEILEQGDPDGWKEAKRLVAIVRDEDPTRPTTAGMNQSENAIKYGMAAEVDVPGFNYAPMNYAQIAKDHPDWPIVGSETSSAVSSRGVYHLPVEPYDTHPSLQVTSYDIVSASWAYEPDFEWLSLAKTPRIAGEFVWTGFDYIGEPTPFHDWKKPPNKAEYPARSAYFGIVDLAGFPKDRYFLYQSQWTKAPMVHLLPHWNWAGRERQPVPVIAYTNGDAVELFLNGRSLGRKRKGVDTVTIPVRPRISKEPTFASPYRLRWDVPYEPGTLRAVAFRDGAPVATQEVRTAGAPARIVLVPDRERLSADGDDVSFVTVRVEDADGTLCPTADTLVRFAVEGPGRVVAVDNGNPASVESFQAPERKAFNGLALVVVRTQKGSPGSIRLRATAAGLRAAETTLTAE